MSDVCREFKFMLYYHLVKTNMSFHMHLGYYRSKKIHFSFALNSPSCTFTRTAQLEKSVQILSHSYAWNGVTIICTRVKDQFLTTCNRCCNHVDAQRLSAASLHSVLRASYIQADDIFKCIFLNENDRIPSKFHWSLFSWVQFTISQHYQISLKFIPRSPIDK